MATGSASAASRMPASSRARISAAADPASAALAGGAAAAVKSPITIWQVQARSQARSPGGGSTWRASMRDSSSAVAAADQAASGALGGAPAGVGGVRALVHGRAPQGRVALAVGRVGRVGGGGVDGQVVGVDLDLGAGRDEAGGRSPAGAGGDGHGQVGAAGDRGDLRGHLGGEGQPGGGGAGAVGGGGGGRGRAHHGAPFQAARGGLDLAAEGERGDRLAEGLGEGVGDHVAVLGGGDPGEVGQRGVQPEDSRDLGEGEQLAELGCPAGLAVGLPGGQVAGGGDRPGVDAQRPGQVVSRSPPRTGR